MNPCCFGISLRTGSLIVASLEIIGSVLGILASLWTWGEIADSIKLHPLDIKDVKATNESDQNTVEMNMITAELFVLTLDTILFSLYFILGVFLVTGVRKGIQSLLQAWIVVKAILITLGIVFLMLSPSFLPQESAQPVYAADIISLVVSTYFFLVIYAYLHVLQKADRETPYEKAEF